MKIKLYHKIVLCTLLITQPLIMYSQNSDANADEGHVFWRIIPDITIVAILIVTSYLTWVMFRHSRERIKKATEIVKEGGQKPKKLITDIYDDFFPAPRQISYSAQPLEEEGFHLKLNYQILIERLARKLYLTFVFIIVYSSSIGYLLYKTSISERIAPDFSVMKQYGEMMDKIAIVEANIEKKQTESLGENSDTITITGNKEADILGISNISVKDYIKIRNVEYEDELVNSVSKQFFQVYFLRYMFVRLFIATVLFTILGYLIRLYFRLREDRNDLILKEEALSTLFSVLKSIDKGEYKSLKEKIPEFPLDKLFESSTRDKKGKVNNDMMNTFNHALNTVNSTNVQILKILEILTPKMEKKDGEKDD